MSGFLDDLPIIGENKRKRTVKAPPELSEGVKAVEYIPVRCPYCKSKKTRIYDSHHLPVRYHLCRACKKKFQSVERLI